MTRRSIALLLAVGLWVPVPAAAAVKRYALVVGNNAPSPNEPKLKPLRYADDDAVRYYQMAQRWGADSFLLTVMDSDTQKRYPGLARQTRPPTKANLKSAVKRIARQVARDRAQGDEPVLYFIFAGHGSVAKGKSYLALLDGQLTQRLLYGEVLARIPAHTAHVIIDACHAGGVVGSRGPFEKEFNTRRVTISADKLATLEKLKHYPHVGVLLATTVGEESHEWSHIESGVFSHEVLSGLSGAADVNHDGAIEYSEIQAFVAAANGDLKDPRAAPRVIAIPPEADHRAPLATLTRQQEVAWIEGEPGSLGHFHVELEAGQRYLDANLDPSMPMRIAIPAGERVFVRTETREAAIWAERGDTIKLASLSFRKTEVEARGSVSNEFRQSLFASPFGKTYYRGFVHSNGMTPVSFPRTEASDDSVRPERRKRAAIAMLSTGGAALAATAISGGLMAKAKRDFQAAEIDREGKQAESRYNKARIGTITSAAAALTLGITGLVLWPKKHKGPRLTVDIDPVRNNYTLRARVPF